MSNLSRTPVQSRNTLDPRSYDSNDNSDESVDRLRQDEEILRVHVDLISRMRNHIRFDETGPERTSVPNQGTAAISAIPMETINLLLAQMVGMMQKFVDRHSADTTIQHQMSSAMEDTIRLSGNKRQLDERFGGEASPIQPLESHEVTLFSPRSVSPVDSEIKTRRPVLTKVNDNAGISSKII